MDTVQLVLACCGGVSLVGGAAAVIAKWIRPAINLVKRVEELERRDALDYAASKRRDEFNRAIAKALIALLEHSKSSENSGTIKRASLELQSFLIDY